MWFSLSSQLYFSFMGNNDPTVSNCYPLWEFTVKLLELDKKKEPMYTASDI